MHLAQLPWLPSFPRSPSTYFYIKISRYYNPFLLEPLSQQYQLSLISCIYIVLPLLQELLTCLPSTRSLKRPYKTHYFSKPIYHKSISAKNKLLTCMTDCLGTVIVYIKIYDNIYVWYRLKVTKCSLKIVQFKNQNIHL